MDFRKDLMETRGYGEYENLDPKLLPGMYLAFRTTLSEGTEVFHSDVRERWRRGDAEVVSAMRTWADYAEQGRDALLNGDYTAFDRLIDANFDLRSRLYQISPGNLEMIETARQFGASANFAGSGGAIVGCYHDESTYKALQEAFGRIGVGILKPVVEPASQAAAATD
jgi:glucuronokinase